MTDEQLRELEELVSKSQSCNYWFAERDKFEPDFWNILGHVDSGKHHILATHAFKNIALVTAATVNAIPQLIQALRQERERVRVCAEALEEITKAMQDPHRYLDPRHDFSPFKRLMEYEETAQAALNKLREASDE